MKPTYRRKSEVEKQADALLKKHKPPLLQDGTYGPETPLRLSRQEQKELGMTNTLRNQK